MRKLLLVIICCLLSFSVRAQSEVIEYPFSFEFEGLTRVGMLQTPDSPVRTLIVLIPGDGPTDINNGMYRDIRNRMTQLGVACLIWDKIGCGDSDGEYTGEQTIQNSASEVSAALASFRNKNTHQFKHVGLWSISRGGWVAPLVLNEDPSLAFWISVSGADDKDNNTYLLEKNLEIVGRPRDSVKMLIREYQEGNRIYWGGGSFEEYLKATKHIRIDPYKIKIHGASYTEESAYLDDQKKYRALYQFDPRSARIVMVPGFSEILKNLSCPVLAVFGTKDSQIDWKGTRRYYRKTIGKNRNSKLDIVTFKECGHVLYKCNSCGLDNSDLQLYNYQPCEGYYQTLSGWLGDNGFK